MRLINCPHNIFVSFLSGLTGISSSTSSYDSEDDVDEAHEMPRFEFLNFLGYSLWFGNSFVNILEKSCSNLPQPFVIKLFIILRNSYELFRAFLQVVTNRKNSYEKILRSRINFDLGDPKYVSYNRNRTEPIRNAQQTEPNRSE